MKLLLITNNPGRASFRQRINIYLDDFQRNGIDCSMVKLPKGLVPRWKLLQGSSNYDAVFLQKKLLNYLDGMLLKKYAKKVIYDFDDAMMYNNKKPDIQSYKRKSSFKRTIQLSSVVIAGNSYLAHHASEYNGNVHVIATGLDVGNYIRRENSNESNVIRLVWIGSKSTLEYLKHIKPAFENIGRKYENVVLRIICDDFFDLDNMKVEKVRWVLEKHAVDLTESNIGLSPLPDNNFTRGKCGFKILQYQAASLPVIASPVGVNTEYVKDGINGYLAETPAAWEEKIVQLIEDPELRKTMGLQGRKHVEQFDSSLISRQLIELITKNI
ncbi:MAG TPA: glycosyltransferase family 4 protein [Desulfatiglandales bacterium]|nr:glycosyltransferase family 4 protein [Desulfatiglandales bacterium]